MNHAPAAAVNDAAGSSQPPGETFGIVDLYAAKTSDMKDLKEKITQALGIWEVKNF